MHMENEMLKEVVENLRRTVKSLDREVELHKLQKKEDEKKIAQEKKWADMGAQTAQPLGHAALMLAMCPPSLPPSP